MVWDFTISTSLGWKVLQAPTEDLIPTVHKIVGNPTFAHRQGFSHHSAIQDFHETLWKIQSETFTSPTLCVWRVVWTWHLVATTGKSRRRVNCSYPKFWHCMWLSMKGYGDTFRIEIGSLCKRHHEIDCTRQCRTTHLLQWNKKGKWELRLRHALEQSFAPYLWLNGWLFY